MTTEPTTTPKPRRRWLQFSLRTMLVLVLIFGAGLGWFAREVQKARAQREAAKAIEKLGGGVVWGRPSSSSVRLRRGRRLCQFSDVARARIAASGLDGSKLGGIGLSISGRPSGEKFNYLLPALRQFRLADLAGTPHV